MLRLEEIAEIATLKASRTPVAAAAVVAAVVVAVVEADLVVAYSDLSRAWACVYPAVAVGQARHWVRNGKERLPE